MKINPAFRDLIPPIAPDEKAQLEANITANGCRDPLVTWNDTLLDGHNRFEICERLELPFKTATLEFKHEDDAKVWILRNQFGRRNLSAYARVELALKLEPLLRKQAKERQKQHGGTAPGKKSLVQESAQVNQSGNGKTRSELARVAGVSHDSIAKGKTIASKASPEVLQALRSGESSINAEYKKLTVHVGHNSGENEWYTPTDIIEAARMAMDGITCDPASAAIANRTVKAKTFFSKDDDGLKQKWTGNVFLNPPYAQPLVSEFADAVCEKFTTKEIVSACVLVNNATDTAWLQKILSVASAICFIRGRIKFLNQAGEAVGAPLQGQVVLYLGKAPKRFHKHFSSFGTVFVNDQL